MADIIKSDGFADGNKIQLQDLWKTEKAYFFVQDNHITVLVSMGSRDDKSKPPAALVMRYNKAGDSFGLQVMVPEEFAKIIEMVNN